jgi:hypothetical protein
VRARPAAVAVAAIVCAGCGAHQFAGITEQRARALAVADFRTFGPQPDGTRLVSVGTSSRGRPLGTFRDRNSAGGQAWLTIFRYVENADEACIWVWRAHGLPWPYAYEETRSVVNGYTNAVHERCVRKVGEHGWLASDETGSEVRPSAVAYPEPVSPLRFVPRGTFLAYPEDTTAVSQSDLPAKFPESSARGTGGLEGFVLDARSLRPIAGAVILAKRSSRLSGLRNVFDPSDAITAVGDRHGAFALIDLPATRYGYDFYVQAVGYAPLLEVHDVDPTDLYAGDFLLSQKPQFVDQEPGPPLGSGR